MRPEEKQNKDNIVERLTENKNKFILLMDEMPNTTSEEVSLPQISRSEVAVLVKERKMQKKSYTSKFGKQNS